MSRVVGTTAMDGITMLPSTPVEDEAKSEESENQQYDEGKEPDIDESDSFDGFLITGETICGHFCDGGLGWGAI